MKKVLVSLLLFASAGASAQQAAPSCPNVSVSCGSTVTIGDTTYFTANISGGDEKVIPTFNWSISNGSIEAGQGTPVISIATAGLSGSITATVDIGGYARECGTSNSCTIMLVAGAKKQTSSGTFTPAAMDFIVREYLLFVKVDGGEGQTAFVYLYPAKSWKGAQTEKMRAALAKAFDKNKVAKDNYKIVVGKPKPKALYAVYSIPPGVAEPSEE